jgi:hypothetical protein
VSLLGLISLARGQIGSSATNRTLAQQAQAEAAFRDMNRTGPLGGDPTLDPLDPRFNSAKASANAAGAGRNILDAATFGTGDKGIAYLRAHPGSGVDYGLAGKIGGATLKGAGIAPNLLGRMGYRRRGRRGLWRPV